MPPSAAHSVIVELTPTFHKDRARAKIRRVQDFAVGAPRQMGIANAVV
jgi:hypothetical protein